MCVMALRFFYIQKTIHIKAIHTCISWKPEIFYISKAYLFFHIYEPVRIPYLEVYLYLVLQTFYYNS